MTLEDIEKKLSKIDELPALPTIVFEINNLLNNPRTTAPELSRLIMRDPALTAKVLKVANSAFFSLPKRITSVNQAIIVFGFNTVRSIVLCSSVIEAFNSFKSKMFFSQEEFWAFSAGVAATARVVARNAGEKKTESSFVAGLLHGLGKVTLQEFFAAEFEESVKRAEEEGISLWQAQREVFGVSDGEVASILIKTWKLSPDIIEPIRFQDMPEEAPEEYRKPSAYLLTAYVISHLLAFGKPFDRVLPQLRPEVMEFAGVKEEQWDRLLELAFDEAQKAQVFFEL